MPDAAAPRLPPALRTGLRVHRSNDLERLAALLAAEADVRTSPAVAAWSPLQPVRVVLGSRGMELWLRHRLAQALGVCTHVRFLLPQQALQEVVQALLGDAGTEAGAGTGTGPDPWSPDALAWAVLAELPDLGGPAFADVRAWLGDTSGPIDRRRLGLARTVAEQLDRVVAFRPEWALAWDVGMPAPGLEDPGDQAWQPLLWQALVARLGARHAARRAQDALAQLADPEAVARLRALGRLHVFGLSALPRPYLEILDRVASYLPIDLYVPSPTWHFWADLGRDTAETAGHPLLASFGRIGADFQRLLEDLPHGVHEPHEQALFAPPVPDAVLDDDGDGDVTATPTLLAWLQSDLFRVEDPRRLRDEARAGDAEAARRWQLRQLRSCDTSLQVHACHGPVRQVEVLREVLLGLFADDPTLEPRDVLVMTPDIEAYAPLVEAVFGGGQDHRREVDAAWGDTGGPRIPFDIADRSLRRLNPVADALLRLLALAAGRIEASAVLDLLALEPVRRRFGFEAEDLPTVRAWVRESGIRWAVDAADRRHHGQPADDGNTWQAGLDRLALGVALADDGEPWRDDGRVVLPFDDMEGERTQWLGRFLDFCRTLFARREALRRPRPMADWRAVLAEAVTALTATTAKAAWLTRQVTDALAELQAQAEAAGCAAEVTVEAVTALLTGRFELPQQEGGQRAGAVTVCSLQPRRNVPFRVICLLGLDDGAFPRLGSTPGFDLVARQPRPGDRSRRDEDRYLFLETLLAARQHLVITYSGRDPRTNEDLPPAVPVGELLDVLDRSFPGPPSAAEPWPFAAVRSRVLVRQPLQPFSEGAFASGPDQPQPLSFHVGMLRCARRLQAERAHLPGLFGADGRLPPLQVDVLELDELVRFLRHPTRRLLQQRLALQLAERDDAIADREPIELDALQGYALESTLLAAALQAVTGGETLDGETLNANPDAALRRAGERLTAGGTLPLGTPGRLRLAEATDSIAALVREVAAAPGQPEVVPVALQLGDVRLQGSVACRGGAIVQAAVREPRADHLLGSWIQLLALQAVDPARRPRAVWLWQKDGEVKSRELGLPDDLDDAQAWARAELQGLVDAWREGLCRPLLLLPKCSPELVKKLGGAAWADLDAGARRLALDAAIKQWEPPDFGDIPSDGQDPWHAAAFGEQAPFVAEDDGVVPEFVELAERVYGRIVAVAAKRASRARAGTEVA